MYLNSASSSRYPIHAGPAIGLSWLERAALLIGIVEIPLQIDKYFFFHEQDAALGAVGGLNISITTIALAVLYGLWLADASLGRCRTVFSAAFGIPMLIYLAINLVSTVSATLPMLSLFDVALLVQAYLLFFYIANRIQTHSDLLFVVLALAATLSIQALFIFYAAAIGMDAEQILIGPLVLTVWEGNRHGGTMHAPVVAGCTLALIWLPVAASLLFIRDKWLWRFALLATSTGLLALLMTQSRGAILTTTAGGVLIGGGMLWRGWLPKWTAVIAVLLGLMSIYPLFHVYQNRIRYGDEGSASSRKDLSLIALQMISARPLMGCGAGNSHLAGQKFADQSDYRAKWYYTIHNKYLLVWAETGIFGLLAFLTVLGTGFHHGISVWRTRDPALSVLGLAIVAAIAGHAVHMAVDMFNSRTQVQILWCVLGLATAVYKISQAEASGVAPRPDQHAETRTRTHWRATPLLVGGRHHG